MASPTNSRIKKVFFDVETNGFNYIRKHGNRHNIIQIGALDQYGNTFNEMVKPEYPIHSLSTKCHHFTNKDVENANDFEKAYELFNEFIFINEYGELDFDQTVCLIAHNNFGFDMYVLFKEIQSKGLKMSKNVVFFDTLVWFKTNIKLEYSISNPRPYSLGSLYVKEFNTEFENAHDAFSDVKALEELFSKRNIQIEERYIVRNGLEGLNEFLRESLQTVDNVKGIGAWRNKELIDLMNESAEFHYKYEKEVPIKDVYDYIAKKMTISEFSDFIRDKLKINQDDYLAEIVSIIFNENVNDVFDKVTMSQTLDCLDLISSDLELLEDEEIYSINQLVEFEYFEMEHSDKIKRLFYKLNGNPMYLKLKNRF
jgi:DNA polymerase III epsilon subunit-like protein